jgi:hypothetical protein
MTPFKGTKIRELCVAEKYISPDFTVTSGIRDTPILSLPQISHRELEHVQRVFSLYVKLPRFFVPLIWYCEKQYVGSRWVYCALTALMWRLASWKGC